MKRILHSLFGWTPKRLARWEKIRAKGAARYILVRAFEWAFSVFASMVIGYYILGDDPSFLFSSPRNILVTFAIFYPAGLVPAVFDWANIEASYLKAREKEVKRAMDENDKAVKT